MGFELVFGVFLGCAIGVMLSGLVMPLRAERLSESVLLDTLIRKRSDRYISAVAKKTTEDEVEAKARVLATERLDDHGVKSQPG